ncbi:MAG: YwaF family protein, partial [Clostridia bacterium]|nr:YwaF family protein [Clostridia bacterium]
IKLFDFTEAHRFMLYFAFVIPIVLFHLMKNKPQDVKRFLMLYLSVALLWVYIGRWNLEDLSSPLSWPLHLCNTAMFLIPICIAFKQEKLFNFCLFINVMGSLLAMLLPSELDGLNAIGTERVSYWVNHYAAFFMPVLLVALKVFKRPKFKQWVYAVIALTVYFLAMLFVNAWFSNYGSCDYFFLNSDFVVSNLGLWAEKTRNFVVSYSFNGLTFTFYPLYQALFYVVYIGFTVGVWFIYALLFAAWDAAEDRRLRERDYRRMKKELSELLGGRSINEPISGDASPRLVLSHFSKRYGSNKHYSVKDVSFEVKGGEIFGFLGPNGAGKSTIIKSMVGIQTITSGDIEICGYNINRQPVQAKLNTGFVPDHYALYENLTGREYINYIADLYQVDAESRNRRIEKYVERFQLTGSFDNQMKTYSHGMKQKITIMSALVHNPKVWILDEPLTGLDPTSIHEVKECMKEHAEAGNVVFFSSHIIDLVEKLCDRIAIIKKGRLQACISVSELSKRGIELEKYYLDIIETASDEHAPYEEPQKEDKKISEEAQSL